MVRARIEACDDGVGRALARRVARALDQSAEHRLVGLVAMEREAGDVGLVTQIGHRAVVGRHLEVRIRNERSQRVSNEQVI